MIWWYHYFWKHPHAVSLNILFDFCGFCQRPKLQDQLKKWHEMIMPVEVPPFSQDVKNRLQWHFHPPLDVSDHPKGFLETKASREFWRALPKQWYPQIINFNRVFQYKPSILGYPYFWKHPNEHQKKSECRNFSSKVQGVQLASFDSLTSYPAHKQHDSGFDLVITHL